mmetsp:Transcript_146175/g.207221  ORF Transcript_146175/g.207221 Transcript_146175/m.207221 type:complete len:90 (+) Transcript_146175:107-376(+)
MADVKPKVGEAIQLRVNAQQGDPLVFKIKQSTTFKKLMEAYCQRRGQSMNAVRFMFNGSPIQPHQCPMDFEMENDDVIDVMLEQVGGSA